MNSGLAKAGRKYAESEDLSKAMASRQNEKGACPWRNGDGWGFKAGEEGVRKCHEGSFCLVESVFVRRALRKRHCEKGAMRKKGKGVRCD